jgi:hypothetical protein
MQQSNSKQCNSATATTGPTVATELVKAKLMAMRPQMKQPAAITCALRSRRLDENMSLQAQLCDSRTTRGGSTANAAQAQCCTAQCCAAQRSTAQHSTPVEIVAQQAANGGAHRLHQRTGKRDEAQLAGGGVEGAANVLQGQSGHSRGAA